MSRRRMFASCLHNVWLKAPVLIIVFFFLNFFCVGAGVAKLFEQCVVKSPCSDHCVAIFFFCVWGQELLNELASHVCKLFAQCVVMCGKKPCSDLCVFFFNFFLCGGGRSCSMSWRR